MPSTSDRKIILTYNGDVTGTLVFTATRNGATPAVVELVNLASGNNTITVPTGGSTVLGCTILPPSANTTNMTLRGVAGDTGVQLHDSDPSSIAIDPAVTSFVLNAAGAITGVRLLWT